MIFFYLTLYLFLKLIDKTNWQFLMGKFGSGTKHCGVNRTKPPLGGYKHTRDGKFIISPSTMAFSFHALSNLPEEKNPINFLISGLICLLFSAPYFPPPPSTRPGPFPTPQDGWRTLFLPLRTPLSLVGSRHATGSIKIVEIANGTRDGMHDDDGFQGEPRVISTAGTTIEKWMRRGGYVILVQNKRKKTWRSLQRNNVT